MTRLPQIAKNCKRWLLGEKGFALLLMAAGAGFIAIGIHRFRVRPEQFGVPAFLGCVAGAFGAFFLLLITDYVLHHAPPFRRMHALHHASPAALIGTPSWLSVALIGGLVFLPLLHALQRDVASGATAGLMLGYLWYVGVHHAAHHRRARPGSYLHRAKQRHAQHHHSPQACNFGVTTALWDNLFGSARSRAGS